MELAAALSPGRVGAKAGWPPLTPVAGEAGRTCQALAQGEAGEVSQKLPARAFGFFLALLGNAFLPS